MILDRIENWQRYSSIYQPLSEGLEILGQVKPDIELGVYNYSPKVKLIVSAYDTTPIGFDKYEAHKRVIDIQYPIIGTEDIEWANIGQISPITEYDEAKDVTFFSDPLIASRVTIGEGTFGIFFPEDGHKPQLLTLNNSVPGIKKLTFKIGL